MRSARRSGTLIGHTTDSAGRRRSELAGGGALLYRTDSDLEAHLEMLRTDPTVRDRLGQAARHQYEREFAAEIHLRKYYALIERVASKSRTS